MNKENLQSLLEDPNILYLYDIQSFSTIKNHYIAIVKNTHKRIDIPDDIQLTVFSIKKWFDVMITKNALLAWKCNCLNKKFILKEHIKLMLTTDPIGLYKQYLERKRECEQIIEFADVAQLDTFWENLFDIKCISEIVENHKIVNYSPPITFDKMLTEIESIGLENVYQLYVGKYIKHIKDTCESQYKSQIKRRILDKHE